MLEYTEPSPVVNILILYAIYENFHTHFTYEYVCIQMRSLRISITTLKRAGNCYSNTSSSYSSSSLFEYNIAWLNLMIYILLKIFRKSMHVSSINVKNLCNYSFVKPGCIKFNSVMNDWMHYWNNHETSIIISITELQGSFPVQNVLSNTLLNLIMFHKINRSLVPMAAPWLSEHWTSMRTALAVRLCHLPQPQSARSGCLQVFLLAESFVTRIHCVLIWRAAEIKGGTHVSFSIRGSECGPFNAGVRQFLSNRPTWWNE